jgi:Mn2+/Fe2+ NRAMP family transporter
VLYLAGARGAPLLALAIIISGVISFIVLSRQRDQMSGALASRIHDWRTRLNEGARSEDD